ncbi:unnamed protein product [Prorocentrum cordatum]|uniref:Uncharacterized protein n=1 Tax=Prorocentrum cordatum TaxID=2364126 RepID=A0ABN9VBF4_9DINO|nr:unnamed protein product [Polarella glacialis]
MMQRVAKDTTDVESSEVPMAKTSGSSMLAVVSGIAIHSVGNDVSPTSADKHFCFEGQCTPKQDILLIRTYFWSQPWTKWFDQFCSATQHATAGRCSVHTSKFSFHGATRFKCSARST